MIKEVSLITKNGGVALGKILKEEEKEYLIEVKGKFYPSTDYAILDKVLRRDIKDIIYDNGRMYRDFYEKK